MSSFSRFPQPFVKWAGGKSQLLSQISKVFPRKFGRYYEPFIGGGATYFNLRPKEAVISDANLELINGYRVIRDDLESLAKELDYIQALRISRSLYEKYRKDDPETLTPTKRAARFIFLNKTCYNGLYRVNKNGGFNVPFGKYRRMPTLYESGNFIEIRNLLRGAEIMCASYEIPLNRAKSGDFLYLDPPYSSEPESLGFTSYTKESFSASDQRRLAAKFKELDRKGCVVMLSNSNTKLVRELYEDYKETTLVLTSDRMINCVGSERTGYRELLILNYTPTMETLAPWVKQAD
jgi:DNA adenine methylase